MPIKRVVYLTELVGHPDIDRYHAMVAAGIDVTMFEYQVDGDADYAWEATIRGSVDIRRIRRGRSIIGTIATAIGTARAIRRLRPDVLICYNYHVPETTLTALLCRMFVRDVVLQYDSKFDDYPRRVVRDVFKAWWFHPYTGVLAASSRAAWYLRYMGVGCPIVAYHCAIDLTRYRGRIRDGGDDGYFLMVARFVEKKNHAFLLDAYAVYLRSVARPRRLVMCGYGPLEDAVRARAKAIDPSGTLIEVRGMATQAEVATLLDGAHALLLPSITEQFGIVVTEALASGVPVLISENCGASDLVDSLVNGLVVKIDEPGAFAAQIAFIGEGGARHAAMSAAAPAAAARASVAHYVKRLEAVRR